MRISARVMVGVVTLSVLLHGLLPAQSEPSTSASTSASGAHGRIGDFENEIKRWGAELADVKKQISAKLAAARSRGEDAKPAPAAPPGAASSGTSGSARREPASAPRGTASASEPPASSFLGSIDISAFVDGYYGYNLQHPKGRAASVLSGTPFTTVSGLRAFDAVTNQPSLNMIEMVLAKSPGPNTSRLGFGLALGYGNAMKVLNSTDAAGSSSARYIKEAYVSYLAPLGKGVELDFGKLVTQHGAEVIETKDNWNYSRGLLFTYAIPFYHFGLRTKYVLGDKYDFSTYLVNGWNNIASRNLGKTVGLQFKWHPTRKVFWVQNYMVGPQEGSDNGNVRQLWDAVVSYAATPKLSLVWNYDYGRGEHKVGVLTPVWWSGVAAYLRYTFDSRYAFSGRYEHYNDHGGFTTGTQQDLNEFTATLERNWNNHTIARLEFRRDASNQPSLFRGSAPARSQNTITGGVFYVFHSKGSSDSTKGAGLD